MVPGSIYNHLVMLKRTGQKIDPKFARKAINDLTTLNDLTKGKLLTTFVGGK
jgi:hypothetical protein